MGRGSLRILAPSLRPCRWVVSRDGLAGTKVQGQPIRPASPAAGSRKHNIGDGSDIDERGPSGDRKSGQGKRSIGESTRRSARWRMSHPPRRSHARLAMTPPAWEGEIAENGCPLELPCQLRLFGSAQLSMPPPEQRSRARARHLFAWECPSLGKTDRNPVRTH